MADIASLEISTAALILQLQIEDLEQLASRSKGKARVDKPSDADVAFQLYKADLDRWSAIVTNRFMAESVGTAVVTDGARLATCQAQERLETRDHEKARRIAGMDAPARKGNLTGGIMHTLQHVQVTEVYNGDEVEASSSRSCGKGPPLGRRIECGVCRESKLFFDVIQLPCGDRYCRECLQKLFEASIADESLFPPRCCRKPLVMKTVQSFLTTDAVRRYNARKEELETPNRTYCYSPGCLKFIPPASIKNDRATCKSCAMVTCTICKSPSHHGDCPKDTALHSLLRTAAKHGWQRCFSCRRVVELIQGCYHMTCPCGAEFCYKCGKKWRSCFCVRWDEHFILHPVGRANEIADQHDDDDDDDEDDED